MRMLDTELLKLNIENRINNDLMLNNIQGASVIVRQDGDIVYKNCFDRISLDGCSAVNDNTIFRLASMTKPITAVATMVLCESGLLSLDDPIRKFLPEFENLYVAQIDESGSIVRGKKCGINPTVKHILTHTSGIGSGAIGELQVSAMTESDRSTLKSTVRYFSSQCISFEPYSNEEYSAFAAFDVLTHIIELVSGMKYEEFLRENIFIPLNMKDTSFVPTNEQWNRMIQMHNKKNGENCVGITYPGCVFEKFPCTHFLGGAGLTSTLLDYSNFAQMLLNYGNFNNNFIISPESVKTITKPHVLPKIQPGSQQWGLGGRVITGENKLPIGTYGWSGAYGTHFWVDYENKITAVYMKNSRWDGGAGAITASNFEEDVYSSLFIS